MDHHELSLYNRSLNQKERDQLLESSIAKGKTIKAAQTIADPVSFKRMNKAARLKKRACEISNSMVSDPASRAINTDYTSRQLYKGNEIRYAKDIISNHKLTNYFRNPIVAALAIRDVLPGVFTSTFRPSGTHEFGAVDFAPRFAAPDTSALVDGLPLWTIPIVWSAVIPLKPLFKNLGVQVFVEWNHFHIHDEWAARTLVQWPVDYRAPIGTLNVMDSANLASIVAKLKNEGLINYYQYSYDQNNQQQE